jgi:predicted Zn-dependent protease
MAAGRFEEAIPIYQRLVKAVPGNSGLLLNLGLAEQMAGHSQAAIPHLQAVLKLQPSSIPALSSLADAYASVNRPADAAPLYRKLTAAPGAPPQIWYGLGKSYEALAAKAFTRLSEMAPQSPYVAALLADSRLQRKQYRSAFFFYREAQAKLPKLPGIHAGLGKVYESTGHADWAATERSAEEALDKTPCTTQSAECLYRRGDYLGATRQHGTATPESLFWTTKSYNRLAVEAFDQLGKFPDSVEIHAVKAEILHGHGQDAGAAAEWRAALALSPGDPQLQRELAQSLFLAHRYDEAIPMLNEMVAHENAAPDLNFMLGESLWRTQKPAEAVPYLTAALKSDPNLLPAHAALGMVYALLNKPAEAVPHLEKALSVDDDGSLHYSLARAYQAAGDTAQAQKTMQQYQQIKQRNNEINDQLAKEAEITAPQQ